MKDFDEFMAELDSKDWSLVIEKISNDIAGKDSQAATLQAALELFTTVLREYHDWANGE